MEPLELIVRRLDRMEEKIDRLSEDKAMRKGALYFLTSIVSAVVSIVIHLFTGYKS